jgi:hypothetical protein
MQLAHCHVRSTRMGRPGAARRGPLLNPYGYGWVNPFTQPV